jgi:tetratricopeptide (TPR) repeat protein
LHERGLDGQVVAQTAAEVPVGRVLGWVLDAKGSVIQRSLRPYHSGELDTQRAIESIVRDVHTCVRILPQQHQFHTEAFHDGNLDRAIITLKQALSQSSRDVYVLRHLLDLYVRTGRLDEALTLAEENRDREEAMPAKWFWSLGQVYLMLGDTDEALRRFDRALELDPSHPVPYRLIAEAHVVRNELHEAEEWLRRAIEREEARSMRVEERIIATYLMLGDVLAKQGRLDAAIATYEELQVTHPKAAKYNILVGERLTAARWQRRMALQARTQPPHAR